MVPKSEQRDIVSTKNIIIFKVPLMDFKGQSLRLITIELYLFSVIFHFFISIYFIIESRVS